MPYFLIFSLYCDLGAAILTSFKLHFSMSEIGMKSADLLPSELSVTVIYVKYVTLIGYLAIHKNR